LKENKGCVVVVSSAASDIPWPRTAPYNTSKAAQHCLLRSLALKLAPSGVRVNWVLPGCIHTEALDRMAKKMGESSEVYAAKRGNAHPMRRCGKASEVAAAALFLASDRMASFVTGAEHLYDA
jgi:3-oxoacyl-[acyl-carrier protein] reductase